MIPSIFASHTPLSLHKLFHAWNHNRQFYWVSGYITSFPQNFREHIVCHILNSLVIKMSIKQTSFANHGKKLVEKLPSHLANSYDLFNLRNTAHVRQRNRHSNTERDFGAVQPSIQCDKKILLTLWSLTCKSAPLSSNFVTTSKEPLSAAAWRGVLPGHCMIKKQWSDSSYNLFPHKHYLDIPF